MSKILSVNMKVTKAKFCTTDLSGSKWNINDPETIFTHLTYEPEIYDMLCKKIIPPLNIISMELFNYNFSVDADDFINWALKNGVTSASIELDD